ncbi:MAG TPA: ATP-grasp domain-containing protein [Treponema sp.]|nr:ATP-grasp domain-containing protein [Treponema sp.]
MRNHSLGLKTTCNPLIVVVYALQTEDYSYFNIFYPSRRLAEVAKNRSIALRFLFPKDVPTFIQDISKKRTTRDTIFFLRGTVPVETIIFIERSGFRCVNSSSAVKIANDKIETANFLKSNGYPTPCIFEHAKKNNQIIFPAIVKPRFGSRGVGVFLVDCLDEIPEEKCIVQEYIADSHGRDFRVFFAGGSILAGVERRSGNAATAGDRGVEKSSVCSNINTGGKMYPSPFTPSVPKNIEAMVLEIAEKTGLWYGAVDFLFCTDTPDPLHLTICEINAFPGFTALEQERGFDIAGALVENLYELFLSE